MNQLLEAIKTDPTTAQMAAIALGCVVAAWLGWRAGRQYETRHGCFRRRTRTRRRRRVDGAWRATT